MSDRIIAILHNNEEAKDNVKATVKMLLDNMCAKQVVVFTKEPDADFNIANGMQLCMNVNWPSEFDTQPKIRNWINSYFKTNGFAGKLHVLEDTTHLLKIPTGFMNDLEHMMDVLDYDVWFSTVSDACNFVYSKYNPRLSIVLDRPEYQKLELGKQIFSTSHSNTQWIVYDFSRVSEDLLKFDEDFSVAMFYIIEYLARRRNTKKDDQIYFMNQYFTVESEVGVYDVLDKIADKKDDPEKMKAEDAIFKQKNVDYSPNNNIDQVLEAFYLKMQSKI